MIGGTRWTVSDHGSYIVGSSVQRQEVLILPSYMKKFPQYPGWGTRYNLRGCQFARLDGKALRIEGSMERTLFFLRPSLPQSVCRLRNAVAPPRHSFIVSGLNGISLLKVPYWCGGCRHTSLTLIRVATRIEPWVPGVNMLIFLEG